jgi:hypothetical protein
MRQPVWQSLGLLQRASFHYRIPIGRRAIQTASSRIPNFAFAFE